MEVKQLKLFQISVFTFEFKLFQISVLLLSLILSQLSVIVLECCAQHLIFRVKIGKNQAGTKCGYEKWEELSWNKLWSK